jgi:chromosome segregation ATPase
MTEPDDLPERVTKLEHEVRLAREDAVAARVLCRGADHDVAQVQAELRAHTGLLMALHQTQREHGEAIKRLDHKFDRLDARVDRLDAKMALGQAEITALLNLAIGKPDGA